MEVLLLERVALQADGVADERMPASGDAISREGRGVQRTQLSAAIVFALVF